MTIFEQYKESVSPWLRLENLPMQEANVASLKQLFLSIYDNEIERLEKRKSKLFKDWKESKSEQTLGRFREIENQLSYWKEQRDLIANYK